MNLAAASGEDLASTSDIVTDALTAFGLQAADSGHFADILAVASSNANTNVSMMGETFKYAAPVMGAMGYTAEDAAIAIGMMANSGIKASSAGTALRTGITNLVKPTKQMSDAMEKYGISVTDTEGNMLTFRDLVAELREKLGGLGEAEQAAAAGAIFGKNSMSGWLALINGSDADLDKLTNAVDNCAGAAERMANVQLDNLNGDLTIMGSAFDGLKTTIGEQFIPEARKLVEVATEVLGWMDKIIQDNPALFKAITGFVGVMGLATAGVVAFNAAAKVASALNLAALFTGPAAPIIAVTAAVAGLAGAVWGMVDAYNKAVPSVDSLTQAVSDFETAQQEAKQVMDDSFGSYEATADIADIYLEKLNELGEDTSQANGHSQEYMATIGLLCDAIPELTDYIDTQTGAIDGGTEALERHIDAWKEDAKQQAYQEYMNELYSKYNDIAKEVAENQIKLVEAEAKKEAASKKLADAQAELDDINVKASKDYFMYQSQLDAATDKVREAQREYNLASDTVDNLNTAIDEGNRTLTEQEQVVVDAQNAIDGLAGSTEDASSSSDELSQSTDSLESRLASVVDGVCALQEAYQSAYDEAYKSVTGQYDLWDQVDFKVETSAADINAALQSQITYWSDYNSNLQKLQDRAKDIEGLDAVINQLSDGSEGSAQAAAALAVASDEELTKVAQSWTDLKDEQGKVSEEMAVIQTGIEQDMDAFTDEIMQDIQNMNYSKDALAAARKTMQAYLDGVEGFEDPISRAVGRIAQNAANQLTSAMKNTGYSGTTGRYSFSSGSEAYASGTDYATPGVHLVGENGPELRVFSGGERVIPAQETKALLAGSGASWSVSFAPQYNISGSTDPGTLRAVLQEHDADLKSQLTDLLTDIFNDQKRVAYA